MNQRDLKLKMKDGSLNLELDYEDCLYKRRYRDINKDKSNKFCVCGGYNNLGHNSTIKKLKIRKNRKLRRQFKENFVQI